MQLKHLGQLHPAPVANASASTSASQRSIATETYQTTRDVYIMKRYHVAGAPISMVSAWSSLDTQLYHTTSVLCVVLILVTTLEIRHILSPGTMGPT